MDACCRKVSKGTSRPSGVSVQPMHGPEEASGACRSRDRPPACPVSASGVLRIGGVWGVPVARRVKEQSC